MVEIAKQQAVIVEYVEKLYRGGKKGESGGKKCLVMFGNIMDNTGDGI